MSRTLKDLPLIVEYETCDVCLDLSYVDKYVSDNIHKRKSNHPPASSTIQPGIAAHTNG